MTVIVLRKFRVGVPRIWDDLRRRQWHPTPVLLPGKSHGQRAWWAAVHGVTKSQTRLRDFTFIFHFHALEKEMATHSSVLAWRIPGTGEPGGLPSMGLHRVGHDWSDLAAAYVNRNLPIYPSLPLPSGSHKFVFHICNSVSILYISSFVPFFYIPHICSIVCCLSFFV